MSQLRRGAILPTVFYILLLTPGFACADSVWSSSCVWPQTTQAKTVDIKHMKPEELNEYETILNTVKLIHVACFNEEVYEIIHNIKTDDARDLVVAFYVYIDHDFHYVGSFGANRKIFKTEIINHDHYFIMNFYYLYIGNGRSWFIDKLIMIPHVKSDIIQFCDDIHCQCEIYDFNDDSAKSLTNIHELGKTAAFCESLVAKPEANKISDAYNTDAIISVKEDSTTENLNQIRTENKLFKLPCICNNGNTYSNPFVDRFLKPCVYPNTEKYQNICPCNKLPNLLGLKPCKFMSNVFPFSCKDVPSIGIDKPSFNSINKQICPLNFLQKLYPSSQYSNWCNSNLFYATYNTKPNINDNLYLKEDPSNTEKSNEFYKNGKVNINQINVNDNKYPINLFSNYQNVPLNDNDKVLVPNITPNGQATAIYNAQSNLKDSQFTVFNSQAPLTNNNENNKVIIRGQPQIISNQNPFYIAMNNGVDQIQPESNTMCENKQKLTKLQELRVDENHTSLPKIIENGLLSKIPKRLDSSATNVYPNNKLTYLQNADLTTVNEIQKFPENKTYSASDIFITNNNYPNIGIGTTDIEKQTVEPLQAKYDEVMPEYTENRFINENSKPLSTQYPKIDSTIINNHKIEYSNGIPNNALKIHGVPNIYRELPQIVSERKYGKIPIGSNINIFPGSIVTSGLANNKQNVYSLGLYETPGQKIYNNYRIKIDNPQNKYAVYNNKIQSTQEKTAIQKLQSHNEQMHPKAKITLSELPEYEILHNPINENENPNVQNTYTVSGSFDGMPGYKIDNNDRIQLISPQNIHEVNLPNGQISANPPNSYQSKSNLPIKNTDIGVLQLNNEYMNSKSTTFAKLLEYKTLNSQIDANENSSVQGIDTPSCSILEMPDYKTNDGDRIQFENPQNVYTVDNNKKNSTQNNLPNEVLSYSLPEEQTAVERVIINDSKLNLATLNANLKVQQLNNEHMNPNASITFTKLPQYEIPNNQIDENENFKAQSANVFIGGFLDKPGYETEFNNPQNVYAVNNKIIQSIENITNPNEVLSYSLPKEQIVVDPLSYESKLTLPTAKSNVNVLQLNNEGMNPKAPVTFEIPNNQIDKKENPNVQSIVASTGNDFITSDYKIHNFDNIQLNNPQNMYTLNNKKIIHEVLSDSLPEEQIAVEPLIYDSTFNLPTPNTNMKVLELNNKYMNSNSFMTFIKLPEYEVPTKEIVENVNPIAQGIDTLTGSILVTPDNRIQLINSQNVCAVHNNKIQRPQNNIPHETFSYCLPNEPIVVNPLNSKSNLNLPTLNTNMKIFNLNNEHIIPKATNKFTKFPEYAIPNSQMNEKENPNIKGIDTPIGDVLISPSFKTGDNVNIQLNNPIVYSVKKNNIPSIPNNKPCEVSSYSSPEKQITVSPLINYPLNLLQLNNEHIDPKSSMTLTKLPEYEIPYDAIDENQKGGVLVMSDYKTDNNDVQLNNPQNINGEKYSKIPNDPNIVPYEVLSYPLPDKQIAVNLPTNYQYASNMLTPNNLQLNNKYKIPKTSIRFTKLPEYEIYDKIDGNQKANAQSVDTYKTDNNDRIQLKNFQYTGGENYNKIPSDQNTVPLKVMSYPLPEKQIAVTLPINYQYVSEMLTPNTLELNNKHNNPKASIAFTKIPEHEIPYDVIDENKKSNGQNTITLTDDLFITPDYKTVNNDTIQLNNPQNIFGENCNKIPNDQNIVPYEILSYPLPEKQVVLNPSISYASKLNQLSPNIYQLKNEHMNPKAVPEHEIPCSEVDGNDKAGKPGIATLTGDLLITPDYKTDNQHLKNPQNAYVLNNNKKLSTQNDTTREVLSFALPEKQVAVNAQLNLPTTNTVALNNKDMNPKASMTFTKSPEYEIPCSETKENNKTDGPSIDILTDDLLGTTDYKTDNYDRKQLNSLQNAYVVENNRIPSIQTDTPSEILSYSLPIQQIAVNSLINLEPKFDLPTPNIPQLNNKDMNPKDIIAFNKLPDYEIIPYDQIDENKNADGQSIDTLTSGVFVAPGCKTDNNDRIQLNNPQNICGENYKKIPSDKNMVPYEILSYPLPEKKIAANLPISYEPKLNQLNPNILQLKNEFMNPKAPIKFAKLPEYEKPCSEIDKNKKADGPSIDTLTGGISVAPHYKLNNNDGIQLSNLYNMYGENYDKIPSDQNIVPYKVLSYPLTEKANLPISYQTILNQLAPNILQLKTEHKNPQAAMIFPKLPDYEIPCSEIDENEKADGPSINTLIGDVLVTPDYKTDNDDRKQLNNRIQSIQNNIPNEAMSYSSPIQQIAVDSLINPKPKFYLPIPNILQLNSKNINPKATIAFNKLPEYEIPYDEIDGNKKANGQSIDTLTGGIFVEPDYKTDNNDRIQLNYPQNDNNRIQSTRKNIPNEVMSYTLPGEAMTVNPPINYEKQFNLSTPNTLQLNNKDIEPKATIALTKSPDYEVPCSIIDENEKVNKQGINTLIRDLLVAPDNKIDNYERIQLNYPRIPQNVYALNNNKIPSTQNNIPCEVLSYSLPEQLIQVKPLTNYPSKLNLPTPTIDMKVLHLNNDYINPKATLTFEIPNNQMDEKENQNKQSIDTLTGNVLGKPYYKIDDIGPHHVYGLNKNKIQSPQNIPDEVLSYSLPNEQTIKPSISYESKLNLPTLNILQSNSEYTNPNTARSFENIPQYQIPNNRIDKNDNLIMQDIDALTSGVLITPDSNTHIGDRIQLDNIQNAYLVNNNKIQDTKNNVFNDILPHSLSNEQIVNPPIIYQSKSNLLTPTTNMKVLPLNKEHMNPKATETFAQLPAYEIANNSDRIQLDNLQNVYAINNNKIQSTKNNEPNEILSYSLPNELISVKPLFSYQSQLNVPTLNTDMGLLQLNNNYINTQPTTIDKNENSYVQSVDTSAIFVKPNYKTGKNYRIQHDNHQNVYAINNNRIQSTQNNIPYEVLPYSLPSEQIAVKPRISYQSHLNVPTIHTNTGILQLNNNYINPKASIIDKKVNSNVQIVDTLTNDRFVTPDYETDNNGGIQHDNHQNIYDAMNNNKIQSAPNNVPYEVLPCSLPYGQIAGDAPISYQSHLNVPTPNTDTGILKLHNDYMDPKAKISFNKLPQYEILNNEIDKKVEPNKQSLDLTGSFVSVNSVFSPQNVKAGIYGPMQIYSSPVPCYRSKLNPSATDIISTETNKRILVNSEKDYLSNYSNSNDYTIMNSGQINDETVSPKETADELKMYQTNYIPKTLNQSEVPQQIIFKNNERNDVPKENYVEFESTLPKYTNLNTYNKLHEVIPKFSPNGKYNQNVVNPLMYDENYIQIKDASYMSLNMNADAEIRNVVKEDFSEDSKPIDKVDEVYTTNVRLVCKNETNNEPIQAAPYNPQINIGNIKLETTNGIESENFAYVNQPSIGPLSLLNADEKKKGNVNNIQNNEYVNLPRKLSNSNDSETNSEVANAYDIELKSNNIASMLPYGGSDPQQYEIFNDIKENPNIEAPDVSSAYITNINYSNKGLEQSNLEVKETLNKPAFTPFEVTDTKANLSPGQYETKYTELVRENSAEENPLNMVSDSKPTIRFLPLTEKITNNDLTCMKPPSTVCETSSTDTLNISTDPDKISEPTINYIKENQNYSPIAQALNANRGIDIQNKVKIPLLDNFVLNKEQPDGSVTEKSKVKPFKDMDTAQTFDNNIMFTPEASLKSNPGESNIVNNTYNITTQDYNICGGDTKLLIYDPKDKKETPIKEKYESYVIPNTNNDEIPVIEINNEFRKSDGSTETPNSELNEILSEMTTLPLKQSADNHFKSLDQPIQILENINLNDYQDLNKNYKLYEEKTCEFLPFGINLGPDKYMKPTSLIFNHRPSQSKTITNPTQEEFSALNEIKYDGSSTSYTPIKSLIASSSNSIPCTDISPGSPNYIKPFTESTSLPQSWLTYGSNKPTEQSLLTSESPIYNVNPCLSQNLNQPTIAFSQAQSTIVNALKSNLLNYIKSNSNVIDKTISIPLADLGVAKYDPIENKKYFTINTENDDINLKAWYSKLKLIKAKITFETVEASALNFIPIVYNKSKYCPVKVQEIAKDAISKVYGEPIVIKGVYTFDIPYVIVDNIDSACIYNGGYILLWPTYCDCGCQRAGCQCYLQNFNDSS